MSWKINCKWKYHAMPIEMLCSLFLVKLPHKYNPIKWHKTFITNYKIELISIRLLYEHWTHSTWNHVYTHTHKRSRTPHATIHNFNGSCCNVIGLDSKITGIALNGIAPSIPVVCRLIVSCAIGCEQYVWTFFCCSYQTSNTLDLSHLSLPLFVAHCRLTSDRSFFIYVFILNETIFPDWNMWWAV